MTHIISRHVPALADLLRRLPRRAPRRSTPRRAHPTTQLSVAGQSAEIDVGIAPLVEALWTMGVRTDTCCQNINDSGKAFLGLSSVEDWVKVVHALHAHGSERLCIRAFHSHAWTWCPAPIPTAHGTQVLATTFIPVEDLEETTTVLRMAAGLAPAD